MKAGGIKKWKIIGYIALLSFIFHLLWENIQAPLYLDYYSFAQHFWPCFFGTIWDTGYTIVIYLSIVFYTKNWFWYKSMSKSVHFLIVTIGLITATIVEKNALFKGKWDYNEWMPLVPIIEVGLTPFLQLVIGTYVVFFILSKINK